MTIHVHDLTPGIIFGYFDAISKECIGKTLKSLLDNGTNFTCFRYVTGKSWPTSPEISVTVCHGSRDPPPSPLPLHSYKRSQIMEYSLKCFRYPVNTKYIFF